MKKASLLSVALLALTASIASAQGGVNLSWTSCYGDGAVHNRTFACASNSGTNQVVGSFIPGADILTASGNEMVLDIQTSDATLSPWWQMKNAGTCRSAALTFNTTISATAVACADWGAGAESGGLGAYNIGFGGPNRARVIATAAVPVSALAQLTAGQEYFSFNLLISNSKTVGTGSCTGCASAACIILNSIKVTQPVGVGDVLIGNPAAQNYVTWQGGAVVGGCPAAVPTHNTTWGAVKSLYR